MTVYNSTSASMTLKDLNPLSSLWLIVENQNVIIEFQTGNFRIPIHHRMEVSSHWRAPRPPPHHLDTLAETIPSPIPPPHSLSSPAPQHPRPISDPAPPVLSPPDSHWPMWMCLWMTSWLWHKAKATEQGYDKYSCMPLTKCSGLLTTRTLQPVANLCL